MMSPYGRWQVRTFYAHCWHIANRKVFLLKAFKDKFVKADLSLLAIFPTFWDCESSFSQIGSIKEKQWNSLNVEADASNALATAAPMI